MHVTTQQPRLHEPSSLTNYVPSEENTTPTLYKQAFNTHSSENRDQVYSLLQLEACNLVINLNKQIQMMSKQAYLSGRCF